MREVEDRINGGAVNEERSPLKEAIDWKVVGQFSIPCTRTRTRIRIP